MKKQEQKPAISLLKRTQILQSLSLICVICMVIALIRISAVLPGVSKEADQKKMETVLKNNEKEYTRGPIVDRFQTVLAKSDEPQGKRTYTHPYAYSSVLGYWSLKYDTGGLEKTFDKELSMSDSNEDDKIGSSLALTLDNDIQLAAYEAISKTKGSAVVLDAKTGEILALTSSPSYNSNKIDEDWEKINETEGLLLSNAFLNPVIPGSVFKLITSTAIIEENVDQEVVHDQGYLTIDGRRINNASKAAYGDLTFQQGFVHSSNVYFMDRMLKLGADSMKQAAKKYLVGEEISLDFTNLKSNFALEQDNKVMLASTAFGQGETLMTTLHMAMVGQSIANDGVMLKPYLIQSIQDGKGKILTKGESEVLIESTNKKTANTIKKAMTAAAKDYGFQLIGDKKYQLAAKTGTAQKGNSQNNAWMIALAPANDPQYVVCINQLDTKNSGIHLKSAMEELCSKLFSE